MKRREFVKGGVAAWVGSSLPEGNWLANDLRTEGSSPAADSRIEIENPHYLVAVDAANGAIVKLLDKKSGINLISEPRLADNFRLLIPLPDLEANYILGREQRLARYEKGPDSLKLTWQGPLVNPQGSFDLTVSMIIKLAGSSIEFSLNVSNQTPHKIAEVWYPILGGFTGIGDRQDSQEMIPVAGGSSNTNLFHTFEGRSPGGGLGITYVEALWSYPAPMPMPWISLYNKKLNRALYFACHDRICRFKVVRFELHPGIGSRRYGSNWPRPEDIDGKTTLGLKLHWAHFPYIKPQETFSGPPVVVQFHDGDWHDSARIYRHWYKSQFTVLDASSNWMRQKLAFADTMFLLPEGNVILRFRDIPKWAKNAADYGVTSVLVSGWNVGGHDGSYPYYEPDPRLGTWDELAEGIRACHKIGVKVFLFANIQPVRVDTDWFKRELHRYTARDRWGVDYEVMGWGMGTLGARLGYTRPPLLGESSGIPEYRKIIVAKMQKLAEIGADGLHIDKLWPGRSLDFNPLSTLSPDQATSVGRLLALEEILRACRAVNPEFALSTECAWDRTLAYSNVAWAWHDNSADHVPVLKYTFPEWFPGLVVPQPFDFTAVNNAVRYGYQIFMGPGNYIAPDSLAYPPMRQLSNYVREVLQILEQVKDTISFGEFLDTLSVQFEGPDEMRFSVFRNPKTGKRACVVVNLGEKPNQASVKGFEGNTNGKVIVRQPLSSPRAGNLPLELDIPSERFVIVAEA
jgi:hypothetical protein